MLLEQIKLLLRRENEKLIFFTSTKYGGVERPNKKNISSFGQISQSFERIKESFEQIKDSFGRISQSFERIKKAFEQIERFVRTN